MVNPGGTGSPMRHISARFAPLPPSSGFIVPLPSVFLPKRYTYFPFDPADGAAGFLALAAFAGLLFAFVALLLTFATSLRPLVPLAVARFAIRLTTPSSQFRKYHRVPELRIQAVSSAADAPAGAPGRRSSRR